jgi:4-amino-4-deoxy-L-arabinose transferase-like glycosyltransferase
VLALLFQIAYSSFVRIVGEGDLQFLYDNAVKIYEGSFSYPSLYSACFPKTVTYPAILAVLFQMFGVHRILPVLLNQLVMSGTIALVYLYTQKRHGPIPGIVCALLLATHPFVILYDNTTNAEILYGACILCCFLSFSFARERYRHSGKPLFFVVPAIFLGLSEFFRPLGVILLLALLLYLPLFSEMKRKGAVVAAGLLVGGYVLFGLLNTAVVQGITGYAPAGSGFGGFNLYVGASETGAWNPADGEEFSQVLQSGKSPDEVQRYFEAKAFERYADMGLGVIPHGLRKLWRLHSADYMVAEAFLLHEEHLARHTIPRGAYALAVNLYYIPILLLALAYTVFSFVRGLRGKPDEPLVLSLYTAGSFAAFLLLEVAPRYMVSYHILFTLLAFEMVMGLRNLLPSRG